MISVLIFNFVISLLQSTTLLHTCTCRLIMWAAPATYTYMYWFIKLTSCTHTHTHTHAHTVPADSVLDPQYSGTVKSCMREAKDTCQSVSTEHKDIHAAISKFGRAVDKVS